MRGGPLVLLVCGCGASLGTTDNVAPGDSQPGLDVLASGSDADAALGAFGPPQKITIASDPVANEDDGTLSYSGLELVFAVVNTADGNRKDLFYASRATLADQFGPATKLPFSTTGNSEETPRFSGDDLTLFFAKTNGTNGLDIDKVTRPTAMPGTINFGAPALVNGVNTAVNEKWFMPCDNSRYLIVVGNDIAEGTLGAGLPTVVPELSSAQNETSPFLTQDCLNAYFASNRPDGNLTQIFRSTRATVNDKWGPPTLDDDFAGLGGDQSDPFLSKDERTFVLTSNIGGTNDIYISTR